MTRSGKLRAMKLARLAHDLYRVAGVLATLTQTMLSVGCIRKLAAGPCAG
jgi:hypothetical protein